MNRILKCFKNNGDECELHECDYCQMELLGSHAALQNTTTLIDKKSVNLVTEFKWYLAKDGYPVSYNKGRIKLHQFLGFHLFGQIPKGFVVDHINKDRLDNRSDNFRMCTQRENSYNTSKRNNRYKGVVKMKNSWSARITKDGKSHVINNIATEKEAAAIYDLMADEMFGEFAGKNFKHCV